MQKWWIRYVIESADVDYYYYLCSKIQNAFEFRIQLNATTSRGCIFDNRQGKQWSMFAISFQIHDSIQFEGIWMGLKEEIFAYFRFHLLFIALYYNSFQMFVVRGSSLKSAQLTGWNFDNCRKHRIFAFRQLCMHTKFKIIEMGMTWMLWAFRCQNHQTLIAKSICGFIRRIISFSPSRRFRWLLV